MKKIILLTVLSLNLSAQWVPEEVEKRIYNHAQWHKLGRDTIYHENYMYLVDIQRLGLDTLKFKYTLLEKKKLWVDHWKAAGVTYFGVAMGSMFVLPSLLPEDKNLHLAAGAVIGGMSNWIAWRYTRLGIKTENSINGMRYTLGWESKLICFGVGTAAGAIIGYGKEYIWDKNRGGTVSNKDAIATTIGAAFGSLGATIIIGNKTKKKHKYDY